MFHPKLIVRTPSLPYSDNISEDFLKQFLDNPSFAEAVYLASPVLFQEALNWKEGKITDPKKLQKIPISLAKYYSRMCSRCTPFGLFAGCGVVNWGEETDLILADNSQRNTRLDMHYAGALAQKLSEIPEIKFSVKYSPNSSVYQIGEEIRYVEYKYIEGKRNHQISAITWSEYIQMVLDLCKSGLTINEMANHLTDDEISQEEAIYFVEQLIENQLLVNELEPAITGEDFTKQIKKILLPKGHLAEILDKVEELLKEIDSQNYNDIAAYQTVIEALKEYDVPFEEGKLFQTDLVKIFDRNSLNHNYQTVLKEIFEFSKNVSQVSVNQKINEFKVRYFDRYETKELPILFAIDTETGVGYGDSGKSNNTPIADGLMLPDKLDSTIKFSQNNFQQFLYKLWLEAHRNKAFQVELKAVDLEKFNVINAKNPPSSSVMFRLTGDESLPIFMEGISGSSAANLLGRFAHADRDVLEIIQDIANQEQVKNPNVIFAEIVHLPENRIGNILLHPPFRAYEIPYLAKSSLLSENQIPLDDLMVSVDLQRDIVMLRSKKLNKEVIPRLSNAHNFSQNSLPLYNFLCDLQTQNMPRSYDLGWASIAPQAVFSPRLIYKNVIISLATWHFKKEHFVELMICKSGDLLEKVECFRGEWNLPEKFVLADYDNELLVNSKNLLSVQTWIDSIRNRDKIELKEFFFNSENSPVKNASRAGFTNQFIASWINEETVYLGINSLENSPKIAIQRSFSLGSEWLYFKFYAGAKLADTILTNSLKPVIEQLLAEKLIDKWFFIRYADPEKHLRFRVHLPDLSVIGKVFQMIREAIQVFENEGIIWKIQSETYQREIERYGAEVMELTESLFCEDSTAILEMLDQTWGDEREPIRWQWALKVIDHYLTDFGLLISEKKELLERMKTSFANEFGIDKPLKLQLDQRFRSNRQLIERVLDNSTHETHEFAPLFESIFRKSEQTKLIIGKIKEAKSSAELSRFLSDTIHMTVNRAISDNQRTHELIMYDFLFRYYQAEMAKRKN
ncbi:MAG: lantibiotic dehydratase [Bacteroidota bacterium]